MPPDTDLAFAKVAAAEVLTRGGKDASVPWENPTSGARGTITPLANAYRMEGAVCRDFLASYVAEGSESWMQGEACRAGKGKWEVRRLKPWRPHVNGPSRRCENRTTIPNNRHLTCRARPGLCF